MPDWLMILVKCVLWYYLLHEGIAVTAMTIHRTTVTAFRLGVPIIAGLILAALEGWITP